MELNERYARDLDKYLSSMDEKKVYNFNEAKSLILTDTPLSLVDDYFDILRCYVPMVVTTYIDTKNGKIVGNKRNDYTREFLDEGGFTELYRQQIMQEKKEEEDRELQRINWAASTKRARQATIEARVSIAIAAGAIILSIVSIVISS